MKNIKVYAAPKYLSKEYTEIASGIFQIGGSYVVSMSFEQEPELGEGTCAVNISQYPLEDILDKFFVYVSDFYPELNDKKSNVCYLEFSSDDLEDVKNLVSISGKHVYNKEIEQDGVSFSILVIE